MSAALLLLFFLTPALCCNSYERNSHYQRTTVVGGGGGFRDRLSYGHAYQAGYMDGNDFEYYNYPVSYPGAYNPWVYYAKNPHKSISPLALAASSAKAPTPHAHSWTDANCTYELVASPLSWYDADVDCAKRNGSRLAVLADAASLERAAEYVADGDVDAWIGLVNIEKWGWLWMDGHSVNVTAWASENSTPNATTPGSAAPLNVDAVESTASPTSEKLEEAEAKLLCASMSPSTGQWRPAFCEVQRNYLCQKC